MLAKKRLPTLFAPRAAVQDQRTTQNREPVRLTDTDLPGPEVLHMDGCRFRIEFLYRDAKQHAGLTPDHS